MQHLPYDASLPGTDVSGGLVAATLIPMGIALLVMLAICWQADRAWTRRATMRPPPQPSHDRLVLSMPELSALAEMERAAVLDDRRLADRLSGRRTRRLPVPRIPLRALGAAMAPLGAGFTLGTFTWSTPLAFVGVVVMGAGAAAVATRPRAARVPVVRVEAPAQGTG